MLRLVEDFNKDAQSPQKVGPDRYETYNPYVPCCIIVHAVNTETSTALLGLINVAGWATNARVIDVGTIILKDLKQ